MNEVAKRQDTQVQAGAQPQPGGIVPSDVVVPRLLLMQGTSDFVKERKANIGDMVRSTNAEKIGDPDKMLEFIPLSEPVATWVVEKRTVGEQRWNFHAVLPRTAANDTLPWRFNADKDGNLLDDSVKSTHEWRRVKCLTLYILLPQDIAAFQVEMKKAEAGETPDISKALTPVLLAFRSTSFKAGKEVQTFFTNVKQFRQRAHNYTLKLGCFLDKNDQGTFYVFKVDRDKPTPVPADYKPHVEEWYNIVSSGASLKVDETGEGGDEAAGDGGNF